MKRGVRIAAAGLCAFAAAMAALALTPYTHPSPAVVPRAAPAATTPKVAGVSQHSLAAGTPLHLSVPALGIQAPVEAAGLTASGEMQSPVSRFATSWYRPGYVPGSPGNAVIAGHSMHIEGPGVFSTLDRLTFGDKIYVDTATHRLIFRVAGAKSYPADTNLLHEVFGASDKARLNLITCTGAWDAATKNYRDRLVVFADFEKDQPIGPP